MSRLGLLLGGRVLEKPSAPEVAGYGEQSADEQDDAENSAQASRRGWSRVGAGVQFASFAPTGSGRFGSRGKSVYESITSWTFEGVRGESAK